jgi:AAA+ ATPase superfamily predicted ATPase
MLQKVWDATLRTTRLFLILCGSYIGMMERDVLGYQAPLYGRRTGSYQLLPLELSAAAAFFPAYAPIQQLEAWAVLGGMPYYLCVFSDSEDLFTGIRRHVLDGQGTLHREPQLLLMEELREPRNYFSILRAIAQGRTRLNEIVQGAGVGNTATTGRYLDILQEMQVVRRAVPATESQPAKSNKGLYRITDAFLRFWFRYVHPYQGALDLGLVDSVLERYVRPSFDQHVSYGFEDAARAYLVRLARSGRLSFVPERIGGWWERNEEIDVVAISDAEGAVLLGECKWSVNPVGTNVLADLKRKAQILNAPGRWPDISYALFAKAGFTAELERRASEEGVRLVRVEDMF